MITAGQPQRLGPKAFVLLLISRIIAGVVLLLLAFILLLSSGYLLSGFASMLQAGGSAAPAALAGASSLLANIIIALALLSVILILLGIIAAILQYRNYTFTFDEFDLSMRHGVLYKKEVSLPYRQIQDVDIDRSFLHIVLGLSRVVMQTAAHEEADEHQMAEVVLEPLDKAVAEDVRQMLERKIGVQVVKDETAADAQMPHMP